MDVYDEPRTAVVTPTRQRTGVPWIAAVIAFIIVAAAGTMALRGTGGSYRSNSVLTINQPALIASATDPGPIDKLVQLRVQYAELMGTAVLDDPIAHQLGMSPSDVASEVSAQAAPNSLLITLQANASSASRARALAQAATQQMVTYAARSQQQFHVPANQRVVLTVATPATAATRVSRSLRTAGTVGLFVGLVAGALAYAAASVARRRW